MSIQSTLTEVRAATEELLIATTRDLDAARTAAKHAEAVAKFYLDALTVNKRTLFETTHRADILARRCAEQAHTIAQLLAKYEPAPNGGKSPPFHPIHAAVAAMQAQGVR